VKKNLFTLGISFTFLSVLWAVLLFYGLNMTGYIKIAKPLPQWLMDPVGFAIMHLRSSLIFFIILFCLYVYFVMKIRALLKNPSAKPSQLFFFDRLLNITISSFFAVGVIWTAVGMESALLQALSGFQTSSSPGQANQPGALDIMDRLVNGGLLIALSTTIVGGGLGYILRFLKVLFIGPAWDEYIINI